MVLSSSSSNNMATKVAKRNIEWTGKDHCKSNHQQDRFGLLNRKRRAEDQDNTLEHRRKSPRIAEKEYHEQLKEHQSRKILQTRSTQSLEKQTARERLTKVLHSRKKPKFERENHCLDRRRSLRVLQQDRLASLKEVDRAHDPDTADTSRLQTLKQKCAKRRRTSDHGDELIHIPKRSRYDSGQAVESSAVAEKEEFIENWVNRTCGQHSSDDEKQISEVLTNMSQVPQIALPSPKDSFDNSTVISKRSERSERSTASTHDADYRQSLRHRNVYIECESAPLEVMKRARRIISRPRASPEMDDKTIQELKDKSRRLQEDGEDEIVQQLAPGIIPAMNTFPDSRLARNANQLWFNAVPLPLDPSVLSNPLPLPKPKPDFAFGYSQTAFTRSQQGTIHLLVDDMFGRSYAKPDQKLHFPFLSVEFKSQAKNGTHYVATNQAAGAGAIAMNGKLDLVQRSFGLDSFDYEEPQFFSVTMDHELARLNVHWLQAPAQGGQHSFHVEGLSKHLLDDPRGIRALVRAIKNILDHAADVRLRSLCQALEAYRAAVIKDRATATVQAQKAGAQGRRSTATKITNRRYWRSRYYCSII